VILVFIFAAVSVAGALFMMVFLRAVSHELHLHRDHETPVHVPTSAESSLTLVMLDRYRSKDLAA
jgi:hypothetical protein